MTDGSSYILLIIIICCIWHKFDIVWFNIYSCSRAWCDKDFYGSDCFTHCVAQDSPSGHWTCDPATGSKVCMSGWWGHNCEKRMFLRLSESYDCYMFAICYIRT